MSEDGIFTFVRAWTVLYCAMRRLGNSIIGWYHMIESGGMDLMCMYPYLPRSKNEFNFLSIITVLITADADADAGMNLEMRILKLLIVFYDVI